MNRQIIVYFDGICSLCSKEIAYYRRIAPAGIFEWRDIANQADYLDGTGLSQADALRYLHVRDKAGHMQIGVDAFICIWREMRFWSLLAVIASLPVIRPILRRAYIAFANYRFRRQPHCLIAAKNTATKNPASDN